MAIWLGLSTQSTELIRSTERVHALWDSSGYKCRRWHILSKTQAELFTQYWKNLKLNPGAFNILGRNCSTHASSAFVAANVVSSGMPGLDTPDNLYKQLKSKHVGRKRIYSGFVGAIYLAGDKYDLVIE